MVHQHLFIDFEFTMPETGEGGKSFFPEIIEVGVVSVIDQKISETYSSFVQPKCNPILTESCKSFLDITQADVDQGISFAEMVNQLASFYQKGKTTVVTWGNMDMVVLKKSCQLWGIDYPFQGKELDLSMEYMKFYGDRNQTGLMKALREYGQETDRKHHRALDDALTTFEIFRLVEQDKKYLQKPVSNCIGDYVDLSRLVGKASSHL